MKKKRYGYLGVQEDVFKKHMTSARKESTASGIDDKNRLVFSEGTHFEPDEVTVEKGLLNVSGELFIGKDELAYLSVEVPISVDLAQDIVNIYLKQLNRLKTILEVANTE